MARDYGKLFTRAWGDPDFRALTSEAQGLYQQLISQPDMSMAGVITSAPPRWAGQSSNGSVAKVEAALRELEQRSFIVRDDATMETLVRSYIRHDLMWRSPKSMIGIDSSVRAVLSSRLKAVIASELLRCDTASLSDKVSETTGRSTREVVEELISGLIRDFPDTPSDTPSGTPSHGGSRTSPTATEPEPEPETEPETETSAPDTPSAFDTWWEHWTKKTAKGDAKKAFPKALRTAGLTALIDGADRYAAWVQRNRIEDRFIVGPGKWLRDERWDDELTDRHQQPALDRQAQMILADRQRRLDQTPKEITS